MKKRDLTKKVLCTVLAASVFGVCGNVSADEPYVVDSNKEITGVELTGQNVIVPGKFKEYGYDLTVTGAYTIGKLDISGESAVNLNVAGNITNGIYMHSGDDLSLIAKDANIEGYINITGGAAKLTGGKIITGDIYEKEEGIYLQEDIRVNEQSYLSLDGVEVNGNIMAEGKDSEINIKNSTVNEGVFYAAEPIDGRYQLVMDENGKPIVEGYTELQAEVGGIVTVENSVLNTSLSAYGEGSKMTVTNSSVKTKGGVLAAEGGKIYLNGNADTVYEVAKDGYFMAASTNQADTTTKIEINGGTLKIENLRYLTGVGPDENGNTNPCLDESYQGEEQTFYAVKGGIVLKGEGVIETKGDQIFANGINGDKQDIIDAISGNVTNDAIKYVGGTLKLTDEKYGINYVKTAKEALDDLGYDSATKVAMTGDLITNEGTNIINVDDIASIGDDFELDKVTVNADKNLLNLLVGSESANVNIDDAVVEDKVANGFSAGKLNLAANSTGMIITNGENVTLGGIADDNNLITVGGVVTDVKVVVGITQDNVVSDKTGSFTIGNSLATSDTVYKLTGSVTVNEGSALNVNGQTTVTGGVELNSGSVNVGNGTLETTNVTANGNSTITGTAKVDTLTGASDAVINVGNKYKAGNVTVTNAELNGATVFLDPTWVDGAEITDASKMAVAGKDGKVTLNGKYVVGENSVMSFGVDNNEKAQETFAKTGLTWGEKAITAGLYINGSVDLNGQAIVVDGNLKKADDAETKAGTFTAAKNSVVMVDGTTIAGENEAAIVGAVTVTVGENSKLYIDSAKNGETYHVIAGTDTNGWADANIVSDNALLVFNGDGNTGDKKFDVTAKYQSVNNVYGDNAVVIDSIVDKTLKVKDEGDKAFDFFNAAANSKINATKDSQIAAFNSVANMGELAGVNHGTYSMSNAMTDAVAHHLSLATHGEQDKDIWAHYIHNKEDIDGMDFGGVDGSYEAQYNGIVVGSDLYKNGKTTAGIALSYADGNINGSNIASSTKNDAEYYGASLYGRIDNGDSAILGDISYMHSDNDITQNNSGHEITASADADAFSIGIRAEQAYKAGAGKFVPYAGIRYMHLGAGDYSNSLGMEYNADDQNLWLLPVGVTYSAEVQSGDWTVKPIAEVGYVWTMGDRDTDQTVSLNGASDTFGFETADSGSFIGRLGIEAEKADVTYGLSYEYQKGDTVKANKWMANLTWSF